MMTIRPLAIRRGSLALALLLVGLGLATASAKTTLRWKASSRATSWHYLDGPDDGLDRPGPQGGKRVEADDRYLVMDMTWTVKSIDASKRGLDDPVDSTGSGRSAVSPCGKFFVRLEARRGTRLSIAGPLFKMLVSAEFTSKMHAARARSRTSSSPTSCSPPSGAMNEPARGSTGAVLRGRPTENMLAQMVIPLRRGGVDPARPGPGRWPSPPDPTARPARSTRLHLQGDRPTANGGLEGIEFSTKFETPKPDPNVPVTFKKETADGRYDFDNAAGRIARSNVAEVVEVSITLEGKEIPQKIETNRTLSLSKDKTQ